MSRKKDSAPQKQSSADIHTTPPEGLRDAIADEDVAAKKGEEILKEVMKTLPPPSPPKSPARSVEDEEDEDEEESVDLDEAADDLGEAAGVFAAGVDTITSALLVILGKFDESLKKGERILRQQKSMTFLLLLLFLGLAFLLYRVENVIDKLAESQDRVVMVSSQVGAAVTELRDLSKAQQKTDAKVDEVKAESEKKPDIEIVSDNKGGAKVVITPKTASKTVSDIRPPKTPETSKSAEPSPPPPIEISIPGSKTPSEAP